MKILEMKRHLNKPDESYLCDLLAAGTGDVVLKYVSQRPGRIEEVTIEAGSTTYAHYTAGRGFVLWKICGPDGRLKGHLFHICKDLQVDETRVEYLDMLLDLWVDPEGRIITLDEDEVEECVAEGVIGKQDVAWIERQRREITENRARMIAEFDLRLEAVEG